MPHIPIDIDRILFPSSYLFSGVQGADLGFSGVQGRIEGFLVCRGGFRVSKRC